MPALILTLLLFISSIFHTYFAKAQQAAQLPGCREEGLVTFLINGENAHSELVGGENPCDDFGGNLAYSPKSRRYVFVNFNIAGVIDLDEVDRAFALVPRESDRFAWYEKIEIAVVTEAWLKKHYETNLDAVLSVGGTTLFVSDRVLRENRFGALVRSFYDPMRFAEDFGI